MSRNHKELEDASTDAGALASSNIDEDNGFVRLAQGDEIACSTQRQFCFDDFELICLIGRGSYAKVLMVELKTTRCLYAMKVINKASIISKRGIHWVKTEKHVFEATLNHPFLTELHSCFQTPSCLFFVTELVRGGDLEYYVERHGYFREEDACFYVAEISLALNYLHEKEIIHRDLKLSNVLLDHEGHIKLTDYGLCKVGVSSNNTAKTFCGTPKYMAPEILKGKNYSFPVDWWALGVSLYIMLTGRSPFERPAKSDQNVKDYLYQVILRKPIQFPSSFSEEAASILRGLLNKNPASRLGCQGDHRTAFIDIKNHKFFMEINWKKLAVRRMVPPFKPWLESDRDLTYFSPKLTSKTVQLTPDDDSVIESINQSQFEGFEFVNPLLTSFDDEV